ncbi:hypothetical protein [uncultured Psychroserpens sp.]|uniref:hypothetical protein n=1 Tax=uncultured Psychroserpens sp. TaxID=255436 RepID=UPI00262FD58D|nr:hypothetical protein [uncultured Psychroserpens sp.]
MKKQLFLFGIIIVLGGFITYVVLKNPKSNTQLQESKIIDNPITSMTDNELEGKRQFEINCVVCHKLNVIVDPPLLQKRIHDYNLKEFQQFIRNEKRERVNNFGIECMVYSEMNRQKIKSIYDYLIYQIPIDY